MPTSEEAEFIVVGNEILSGHVADTNSAYASRRLYEIGIKTSRKLVVPDDLEAISEAIRSALSRKPRYLIIIGGLGATPDDVTKEALAKALGKKLVLNEGALRWVEELAKRRGVEVDEDRKKYAMVVEGSEPIPNKRGAACGIRVRCGETEVVVLPGPPREFVPMMDSLIGVVFKPTHLTYQVYRLERKEEVEYRELFRELSEIEGVSWGSYPLEDGVYVRIESKEPKALDRAKKAIERFGGEPASFPEPKTS